MQPFERHQADLGALEACASQLVDQAAEAMENGDLTRQAYQPAVENWDGMGAPELRDAVTPLQDDCQGASHALAWAGVVARYWAGQVQTFNAAVDAIDQGPHYGAIGANGEPPSDGAVEAARSAARQRWWEVHDLYILEGGNRVEAMLRDGPTQEHVSEVRAAGVLPGPGLNPLPDMANSAAGEVVPPDRGWFDQALWTAGRGLFVAGTTGALMDLRYRTYVRGHWRGVPSGGRTYVNPYWRMRPGMGSNPAMRASQARWARGARWAGRAGTVVAFGTSAWDQWSRDAGRSDIGTGERVARAGTRGALVAGGAWAGAAVGAKGGALAGAAIGSIFPGPGTAIGAAVGGIVGGVGGAIVGSGLANMAADYAVEGVSWAGDRLSDGVDWAGDRLSDAGDMLSDAGDALGDAGGAVKDFVGGLF